MIDTVVLVFDLGDFRKQTFIKRDSFGQWTPNLGGLLSSRYQKGKLRSTLRPSSSDKRKGLYRPRLTVIKQCVAGGFMTRLYVELSAPKLLFGNNFSELEESDFDRLCNCIRYRLLPMGVDIPLYAIQNARVWTIHFGKNIVFTDGTIPATILSHLKKNNISSRQRTLERDYKNGGEALYVSTKNHQFCLYDKRKELENARLTEVGNSEKDNWYQVDLFKKRKVVEPFQVLRLEARFITPEEIQNKLEKAGVEVSRHPTFKELFRVEISRKVLKWEIAELERTTPEPLTFGGDFEDFVDSLKRQNPKATPTLVAKACMLQQLRMSCGLSTARKLLRMDSTNWSRLLRDFWTLKYKPPPNDKMAKVRCQIAEFKPVKLDDYAKKCYNKRRSYGKKKYPK